MKQLTKKGPDILIRLLAVLGLVLMTACSRSTPTSATQPDDSGNVILTFADLRPDQGIDYQAITNGFHQKNPSITVKIISADHPVPLADADIAKQADVIFLSGENPATLPGFIPLQPLLDASPDFNSGDLWPGSMTACSDSLGSPYGVPLTLVLQGVYYNPSLFDQLHVDYPQPGWTWSEFQQSVSQLSGTANGTTIYGFVDGPFGFILEPLLDQQLSSNGGKVDAQAIAASIAWYVQLAKDKKLYPMQPAVNGFNHLDEMTRLLENNQAAMWVSLSSDNSNGNKSVYLPYPVDQPEDHTTPVYANCGAISAGSKSPQAAWAWLDFLTRQGLTGGKTSGLLPARQSLTQTSPYFASRTDQERNAMQYGLAHAWYYPSGLGNTLSQIEQAIATALQSGMNLADALKEVAASASALAQATPTPTAKPVALNTPIATPTNLPENVLTISFNGGDVIADPVKAGNEEIALKALVAEFEKIHPDIKVLYSTDITPPKSTDNTPPPTFWNVLQTLAQDNDCFEYRYSQAPAQSLPEKDLLDLTPFLDAIPAMKEDFYPAFLRPFENDGKLYGLPAGVDVHYIAYNADLLARLGIPFPQPGWTVDDLLSIASRAANRSTTPPIYGFGDDNSYIFHTLNVPYYDTSVQPPRATFTSDEVTKAYRWFQQLFQKGTLDIITVAHFRDYHNEISQGQMALWVTNGFWNYNPDPWDWKDHPLYEQNFPFKVGYAPLPMLVSGVPMSMPRSMAGYYISSHTTQAKAQACWDWIRYLSDHPNIFGGFSPRQSVLPKEDVGQDPARFAVIQEAIQQYNTDAFADYADTQDYAYSGEMITAMVNVFNGGDVLTALAEAQRVSDAYRACIAQKDLNGLEAYQIYNLVFNCYVSIRPLPTPPP